MRGNIWVVAVVAIALAVFLPAINVGYEANARVDSDTEALTIQTSGTFNLSEHPEALSYVDNETVTSPGETYVDGTDYTFDTNAGRVTWMNSTRTQANAGEDGSIAYEYRFHNGQTRSIAGVLGGFGEFIGLFFLAVCLGGLLVLTFGGDGF